MLLRLLAVVLVLAAVGVAVVTAVVILRLESPDPNDPSFLVQQEERPERRNDYLAAGVSWRSPS
jgi:hypothetical protein